MVGFKHNYMYILRLQGGPAAAISCPRLTGKRYFGTKMCLGSLEEHTHIRRGPKMIERRPIPSVHVYRPFNEKPDHLPTQCTVPTNFRDAQSRVSVFCNLPVIWIKSYSATFIPYHMYIHRSKPRRRFRYCHTDIAISTAGEEPFCRYQC